MRSRLEALWAAQFDEDKAEGIIADWAYEPACFADETGQYLPDFRIDRVDGISVYIEIKPEGTEPEPWQKKMEIIFSSEPDAQLRLILGSPADLVWDVITPDAFINDGDGWVGV